MLFNSFTFVLFFLVVYGFHRTLSLRGQNVFLLVASYIFYGAWDWRFLILIWFSSTLDFLVAPRVAASGGRKRRAWLCLSLIVNFGILGIFKYFNFFAENAQILLTWIGFEPSWLTMNIVLPVGISFYTFQTLSYTVDVYRGHTVPTRSYVNYLLFVSFFPQLVAGPIERSFHLLNQVERPRRIDLAGFREGAWLVLLGYYKKVVMADNLAPLANQVFESNGVVTGLGVVAGLLAFAFQIYGDFSGYSDIARGVSRMMGFDLMVNFRMPYFAINPSDFWRRWHISLSTWLRDYLYIPLGGNRSGNVAAYRNLLITMMLGGLWHGASWHFVAWGVYHGLLLIVFKMFGAGMQVRGPVDHLAKVLAFFPLTLIGWLLFRASSLADAWGLAARVLEWSWTGKITMLTLAVYATPILILELFQERSNDLLVVKRWHPLVRLLVYCYLFGAIVVSGVVGQHAFIYFQF